MLDEKSDVKPSAFERHFQTGIQLLLIALLAWSGAKLVSLGESTAVLRERLIYQGDQIASLRRDIREWSDLYQKKSDASRNMNLIDNRLDVITDRIAELEDDE